MPGAALVTGAVLLIVYALTQAPAHGWGSPQSVTGMAGGAALLGGFALYEARTASRLVPFGIFRVRNLAAGNIAYLGNVAAFASVFFFPTLYLQDLPGFSPLRTGLAFLPMAVAVGVAGALGSRAMDALEVRWPGVAAHAARMLLRMPAPITAPRAYVPPPLSARPIRGRAAVLRFWQDMPDRYQRSTIRNLSIEETGKSRFVRTARLSHTRADSTLEYVIRQTTEIRHGRVIRQVNELV